jgi:hypothetical protein
MPSKDRPRWVDFTPEETEYRLIMFKGGAGIQEIGLDREEYEHLKSVLAKERGYAPAGEEASEQAAATPNGRVDPLGDFDCIRKALDRSDRRCSQFLVEEFRRDAEDFLSSAQPSEIAFMSAVFTLAATDGDLIGYIFRALNMDADDLIGPAKAKKGGVPDAESV